MPRHTILGRGSTGVVNTPDGGAMIQWTDGQQGDPDADIVQIPLDPEGRKVIGRDLLGQGIQPATKADMPNGRPPGSVLHRRG
jgi:hypothetical protein